MEHTCHFECTENGQDSTLVLENYLDRPGKVAKQFAKTNANHKHLFYKNKKALPYATFVSKFQKNHYIFHKAKQGRNPQTQV